MVPPASETTWPTVFFGSFASGWSTRTTSLKKPLRRPSTIFGSAASGLPSLREVSSAMRRSFSTVSAGTSSRERYVGDIAATCCATSFATASPAASVATTTPIDGGRSRAVRWRYAVTRSPATRVTRRRTIFSPSVAAWLSMTCWTVSPSASAASAASASRAPASAAALSTRSAREM